MTLPAPSNRRRLGVQIDEEHFHGLQEHIVALEIIVLALVSNIAEAFEKSTGWDRQRFIDQLGTNCQELLATGKVSAFGREPEELKQKVSAHFEVILGSLDGGPPPRKEQN
jgi:hypothetical protein